MQPILHSTVSFWSGGINLNLQGNLQSATKHGNPANFISSYKSASDPKTSLVLGEIENDAYVFFFFTQNLDSFKFHTFWPNMW